MRLFPAQEEEIETLLQMRSLPPAELDFLRRTIATLAADAAASATPEIPAFPRLRLVETA